MRLDEAKAVLERAKRQAEARRQVADAHKAKAAARSVRPPRRAYVPADLLRIAYLAGAGKSAGEIADAVGGTTRDRVAAMLSNKGIALLPKRADEVAITVVLPKTALSALSKFALARDTDPALVAAEALRALADEPTILANLVDDEI